MRWINSGVKLLEIGKGKETLEGYMGAAVSFLLLLSTPKFGRHSRSDQADLVASLGPKILCEGGRIAGEPGLRFGTRTDPKRARI